MHWYFRQNWGTWGGHWLMMLLVWAAIIGLIVWVVRSLANGGHSARSTRRENSALEVLDERYAKGEISKDEYLERRETLLKR